MSTYNTRSTARLLLIRVLSTAVRSSSRSGTVIVVALACTVAGQTGGVSGLVSVELVGVGGTTSNRSSVCRSLV